MSQLRKRLSLAMRKIGGSIVTMDEIMNFFKDETAGRIVLFMELKMQQLLFCIVKIKMKKNMI